MLKYVHMFELKYEINDLKFKQKRTEIRYARYYDST